MARIEKDFSDVKNFLSDVEKEVVAVEERVGQEAVDYAVTNGNYHDVTGHLRRSNTYEARPDGLIIKNTASYASKVEARGKDVSSGAALYAERRLKEEFER